jgi:hypothetical protein
MVRIGDEISSKKGDGIVRGMFGLTDGRIGIIAEKKGRNFVLIEGDDF